METFPAACGDNCDRYPGGWWIKVENFGDKRGHERDKRGMGSNISPCAILEKPGVLKTIHYGMHVRWRTKY
jgi:hypothetical protein